MLKRNIIKEYGSQLKALGDKNDCEETMFTMCFI